MRRIGLFLLAVVMMAGCGGGSEPDPVDQDYSGVWTMTITGVDNVVAPCGTSDVVPGDTDVNSISLDQNGSAVTAILTLNFGTLAGAGTVTKTDIKLTMLENDGAALLIQGMALDDNTASGTWKWVCNGITFDTVIATFTMSK